MFLNRVLTKVKVVAIYGNTDIEITTLTNDSRECTLGSVYVDTAQDNGYITRAVENGAVCVISKHRAEVSACNIVVEDTCEVYALMAREFYGSPDKNMFLFGVTGTNGKTSVAEHIHEILAFVNTECGRIGTLGIKNGSKSINTGYTTPNSVRFYSALREMADNGLSYAVSEVSSHALALKRVYGTKFNVGAITNVTSEHLDYHKTIEEYVSVKASFESLCKSFLINIDDKNCSEIYKCLRGRGDLYTFSLMGEGDFNGELLHNGLLRVDYGEKQITVKPSGEMLFSAYNALCAVAMVILSGVDLPEYLELPQVRGRMELVSKNTPYNVYIDYAHTEDSMRSVLADARKITKGRLITVFSCGGERDKTKRRPMGIACSEYSDISIITSDNPRGENELVIASEIISGIEERCGKYEVIIDRRRAIEYAVNIAKENDTVLILGKGHEEYQIINSLRLPFSDREVVIESINQRNKCT